MFKFNPDGSIQLPSQMQKKKDNEARRLNDRFCVKIRKDVVSTFSPKSCKLEIKLSNKFVKNDFVNQIYNYFKMNSSTPIKLNQITDKEFIFEIGTDFRRCSDCKSIINRFRDHLDGNVIEDHGTCTAKKRENFSYDDYFE